MSCVAAVSHGQGSSPLLTVFTKGAPEEMRKLLRHVPENYDTLYRSLVTTGKRVLCIAKRNLDNMREVCGSYFYIYVMLYHTHTQRENENDKGVCYLILFYIERCGCSSAERLGAGS